MLKFNICRGPRGNSAFSNARMTNFEKSHNNNIVAPERAASTRDPAARVTLKTDFRRKRPRILTENKHQTFKIISFIFLHYLKFTKPG